MNVTLPETGFLRLDQIVGNRKKDIPAIIPISRGSWLNGVSEGRFPEPVRSLGKRMCAWRVEDIRKLIENAE